MKQHVMSYQDYIIHSLACPDTILMWLIFVSVLFFISTLLASALSYIPHLMRLYIYKKTFLNH